MFRKDVVECIRRSVEVGLDNIEDYNDIFDTDVTEEEVQKVIVHLMELINVKTG